MNKKNNKIFFGSIVLSTLIISVVIVSMSTLNNPPEHLEHSKECSKDASVITYTINGHPTLKFEKGMFNQNVHCKSN